MMGVPVLSLSRIEPVLTVSRSIGSSKMTSTFAFSGTPLAPASGLSPTARGGRVSGGLVRSNVASTQ